MIHCFCKTAVKRHIDKHRYESRIFIIHLFQPASSDICSCCLLFHIDFIFSFYCIFDFPSISLSFSLSLFLPRHDTVVIACFKSRKKETTTMKEKKSLYRCIAYRGLKMFVLCQVWDDRIMCSFVMYWLSISCDEIHTTLYLLSDLASNRDEQMHIYINIICSISIWFEFYSQMSVYLVQTTRLSIFNSVWIRKYWRQKACQFFFSAGSLGESRELHINCFLEWKKTTTTEKTVL